MTRQDIYYVAVHILAFALGYATCMNTLLHASPVVGWFDWGALTQGLIAMGVTNLGSNVSAGSGLSSTARFLHLTKHD